METYLTTEELSARIKYAPGTIHNLVYNKTFVKNVHYIKPTEKKLLFVWSAIEAWLHGTGTSGPERSESMINI